MHTVGNQQHKEKTDQGKQDHLAAQYEGQNAHYRADSHKHEHQKMHQSLMGEKGDLILMLCDLLFPVSVIFLQHIIDISQIGKDSLLHATPPDPSTHLSPRYIYNSQPYRTAGSFYRQITS